jgi:hypothetical protein
MKWNDIYWIFQTFLTNQKLKNWGCKIIQFKELQKKACPRMPDPNWVHGRYSDLVQLKRELEFPSLNHPKLHYTTLQTVSSSLIHLIKQLDVTSYLRLLYKQNYGNVAHEPHQNITNGPVRSWILHRSFIPSPEHKCCSELKFCEVEEIPLFSMKIHSLSILCP